MDKPRVALRFRNYIEERHGVNAHRAIIDRRGFVWWGWWKRDDEPNQTSAVLQLKPPYVAALVSPTESLEFSANVLEVATDTPDRNLIPRYYRKNAKSIPLWFKLDRIDDAVLDSEIVNQLLTSGRTLMILPPKGRATRRPAATAAEVEVPPPMTQLPARPVKRTPRASAEVPSLTHILHLSDIHLGSDHNFLSLGQKPFTSPDPTKPSKRLSLIDAINQDLKRAGVQKVAAIIVSGDIVSRSQWDLDNVVIPFFRELLKALGLPPDRLLVVPGNHDFYRQDEKPENLPLLNSAHELAFRQFRKDLFGTERSAPLNGMVSVELDEGVVLKVGLLNSARWTSVQNFYDYGFVGKEEYKHVLQSMEADDAQPTVRILVLHHHLVPITLVEQPGPTSTRPVSVTLDAPELLRDAQKSGVSLILHGHQHTPDVIKIAKLRPEEKNGGMDGEMYVLAAGSAGSKELGQYTRNTYSILTFGDGHVQCRVRELDPTDTLAGKNFADVRLPLRIHQ